MRHPQPQWLVRITAESGSLTLPLVSRPRHQPPVVIQLYSVYGLISNTMFAQSKEMNQAVDIYTALSTHRKVQISIRTMSTQLCSSSDLVPTVPRGPPQPSTRCIYLHTRYIHSSRCRYQHIRYLHSSRCRYLHTQYLHSSRCRYLQ